MLHSFSGGKDGATPESTLIFDNSGNLYGTTRDGGAHGFGVAFQLVPNTDGTWKRRCSISSRAARTEPAFTKE